MDESGFDKKCCEILELIQAEIEKTDNLKNSAQHLNSIVSDIKQMQKEKSIKRFMPSYPRMIIDSWGFDDILGLELMKLFNIYQRL